MNAEVGQAILTIIKSIFANSYYNEAPRNATFPYAVFSTPSTFKRENIDVIILEINIWDNVGNSISALEAATLTLKKGLEKYVYQDTKTFLKFEVDSILQIPDPEFQIRRRQIRLNVKYIDRR